MAHSVIQFHPAIFRRSILLSHRCVTLKHRGILCGPISEGYESRTIPIDLKDDSESRRNQQVYSASPVKTVDKNNDSGECSFRPYSRTEQRSYSLKMQSTHAILIFGFFLFAFWFGFCSGWCSCAHRNVRNLAVCDIQCERRQDDEWS